MWYLPVGATILIIWGVLTLRAIFLNKKALSSQFEADNFLMKFVLGKHHDRVHNLIYGTLEVVIGVSVLMYYLEW